jgi:hypothetical protein
MPESKRRKPKRPAPPLRPSVAEAKSKGPSPTWYVAVMWTLIGVGLLAVLARFIFELPQYYLFGGFAMIAAGFIMFTNYR